MKKTIITLTALLFSVLVLHAQNWSTTGNTGTSTPTNYIGNADNVELIMRTNSRKRLGISASSYIGSKELCYVSLNQPDSIDTPVSLNVYATDMVGYQMPVFISCDITGMTYDYNNGSSNTLGRFIRLNQGNTNSFGGNHFYDFGMQDSSSNYSFYITQHQVPGGGYFPKKMVTISSEDRVGINLDWSDQPTASTHTKGTVRHQDLPGGEGNYLVVDRDGNVYVSSCSSRRCGGLSEAEEINKLKAEVAELKQMLKGGTGLTVATETASKAVLQQNMPNPFSYSTTFNYSLPLETKTAMLNIYTLEGKQVKTVSISPSAKGITTLQMSELNAGLYLAMIVCDNGITSNSIKLVVAK